MKLLAPMALALTLLPTTASAQDGGWLDGVEFDWKNRVSVGAAIRVEGRNPNLVGKSNLDPNLCAADECLAVSPDELGPNARYLAAPGARNSVYDEGNLNYDKGDFISSPVKWTSRLKVSRGNLKFEAGVLLFYDYINTSLRENHPNQVVAPGAPPGQVVRNKRDIDTIHQIGYGAQLLDTYVQDTFDINGQAIDVSIGRQRLVWGEASFATQGSLNFNNPPDVNNLARPGGTLDEVYKPAGMVVAKGPFDDDLSFETFYQFEWRPVGIPPRGSYLSFFNASNHLTANEGIIAPFAKAPYDPLQIGTPGNDVLALVSETSLTLRRGANRTPSEGGQYGLALYWHPDDYWFGGSELGFYYARYHSRIPTAGATAADASCARREGNEAGIDAVDLTSFIAACGVPGTHQREAVPLDSAQYFLEYPEDIHLFGLSFSTLYQGVAVRGEFSFRPNQPVQVDLEDVLFAALQPALPRNDIPLFGTDMTLPGLIAALQDPGNALAVIGGATGNLPGAISSLQALLNAPGVLGTTVPGSRTGIPDFVTAYRGGVPGEVAPGTYIRGYERLQVQQASLGLTRVFGNTGFLGTKDTALLLEVTEIWIPDLPSKSRLQFEAPGTDTHGGPGVADTANALRINPIQNTGGYVTPFSWGYRVGALLHYTDVLIPGLEVTPFLVYTHDVGGVSPGLAENFLEGRKIGVADLRFHYGSFDVNLIGTFLFGGGRRNTLSDRDFVAASVTYSF